jgi:hypothetical protein
VVRLIQHSHLDDRFVLRLALVHAGTIGTRLSNRRVRFLQRETRMHRCRMIYTRRSLS